MPMQQNNNISDQTLDYTGELYVFEVCCTWYYTNMCTSAAQLSFVQSTNVASLATSVKKLEM